MRYIQYVMKRAGEYLKFRAGFTLVEMVMVIMLIGVVACFAALKINDVARNSRIRAAEAELETLRKAFVGTPGVPGLVDDLERLPGFSPVLLRVGNLFTATNLWVGTLDRRSDFGYRWDDLSDSVQGYAKFAQVTNWSAAAARGWHGPYARITSPVRVNGIRVLEFPQGSAVRNERDVSFRARGFFPDVSSVSVPSEFRSGFRGCSIYGYPGEHVPGDPWGNPYVLQVPPPQAFIRASDEFNYTDATQVPYALRFKYARLVSAGPDGVLSTPCFSVNVSNITYSSWTPAVGRSVRLAGRSRDGVNELRGDDIVLFLNRSDVYED